MNLQIRIEGTRVEIEQVLRALPGSSALESVAVELNNETTQPDQVGEAPRGGSRFVTAEFARRALTRRPLRKRMRVALKTLLEAGPEWVSQTTLRDATDCTPAQFAGLMGAFGRRFANTRGYNREASFFDYKRSDDDNQTLYYRLPETVREVLDSEGLV